MKRLKWFAFMALCLSTQAYGQTAPSLEFGSPEQTARVFPLTQLHPNGNVPRFMAELLERAGIAWHASSYPAPRLMRNLQSGETQISLLVKNPLLNECCLYSKTSFWLDELRVYWLGDKTAVVSRDDLKGKSVIGLAGFSYGGVTAYLQDPANAVDYNTADSHEAAFAMLKAGRADYVLDYSEPAEKEALAIAPLANLRHATIDMLKVYLVMNKSVPQAQATLDRLEHLHAELRAADPAGAVTRQ